MFSALQVFEYFHLNSTLMKKMIILVGLFFIFPTLSLAEEYAISPPLEGSMSTRQYFDSQKLPNVYVTTKCPKKGDCWKVIVNHKGKTLKSFGSKETVSTIASGRYRNFATALIKRSWKCGDKYCTEQFLINDKGKKTTFSKDYHDKALASLISKQNTLIMLTSSSIVTVTKEGTILDTTPAPVKLTQGILRNNPDGEISAIAVANDQIVISNRKKWVVVEQILTKHGDREKILGVYPDTENVTHGIVYKYVNAYCKGLYYIKADFQDEFQIRKGWIFNSEDRNIGWEPDIHSDNRTVFISSINSSSSQKKVHFSIPKMKLSEIEDITPEHLQNGGCFEQYASFMVGGGLSKVSWRANSQIEKNDRKFLDVEYDISDSLFMLAQFEGRIGETQLSLSYLRNQSKDYVGEEAEEAGGELARNASDFLFGQIDFYGLISKSSSLRLVLEKSTINGVAKVKKNDFLLRTEEFESKYDKYAALVTREKGAYYGLQYEKYTMPSAVGFSDSSKQIVFADFDKEFCINKVSFLVGYDVLAYSKRYETNYRNWYFAGNMGMGLLWVELSDEIESRAETETGNKEGIDSPWALAFDAMIETGYIWQQKMKSLNGFGYALQIGYRAKGSYMGAGQSDEGDATEGLALEFERYDVLHGPFVQFSMMY
jgi:hypothetical protein